MSGSNAGFGPEYQRPRKERPSEYAPVEIGFRIVELPTLHAMVAQYAWEYTELRTQIEKHMATRWAQQVYDLGVPLADLKPTITWTQKYLPVDGRLDGWHVVARPPFELAAAGEVPDLLLP